MPYHLSDDGLSVLKDDGKVVKKHPSKAKALAHLRALQVNVPEAGMDRDAAIREAHTPAELRAQAERFGISLSHAYRLRKGTMNAAGTPAVERFQGDMTSRLTFGEIGTYGLKRSGGLVDEDYDRTFKPLSRKVKVYKEMGDDPIVAAVLQAIKMLVRRVDWYVQPASTKPADREAAEFLESCMGDMSQSWMDVIDQALSMLQYGFSVAELVYKRRLGDKKEGSSTYDDGRIGWRKWLYLAPHSLAPGEPWTFDEHGGIQAVNQLDYSAPNAKQVTIPIDKAMLFRTTAENNNPEGQAILRAMYWPYYIKRNLEEIEAISAERLGAGLPVIYAGNDVAKGSGTNTEFEKLKDIVRNVRVDDQMGVAIPFAKMGSGAREGDGVLFELLTPAGGKAVDFNQVITRYEQRMTMVGLAQFIHLGMNQVGARALGESSTDFFTLSVSGWADLIEETIHRYATERLMRLNHFPGITGQPRITHESIARNSLTELADYINKLVGAMVITPDGKLEEYLRELAELPERELSVVSRQASEESRKQEAGGKRQEEEGKGGQEDKRKGGQEEETPAEMASESFAELFIDVPDGIMISFKIDPAIGKLIKLSEGEPVRDMHISLALPGKVSEYSEEKLDRLTEVIRGFALISRALSGVITGPGEFAPHDGKKPVVLLVDVPGLPEWRQRLVDILNDNGFSVADNHGFIPHITLKYADADERVAFDFEPIRVTFDRVSLKIGLNERSFKLGGGVDVGADSFAIRGGGRPGRRSGQIEAVNAYQAELQGAYDKWSEKLSADIAAEEDDDKRDELIAAALALLLTALIAAGRRGLTEAFNRALNGTPPSPQMLDDLSRVIQENETYLISSLLPAIGTKLRAGLMDADIIAALMQSRQMGAEAIKALLATLRARVGSYSGNWWAIYNHTIGLNAPEKVAWYLDPQAKHCHDCPRFGSAGGTVYDSYEAMLAATGGREPARGVECGPNCRCEVRPVR